MMSLYKKYYLKCWGERLGQFVALSRKFRVKRVLYPGSFVHITPSFVFPNVVYVDSHKKAKEFFDSKQFYPLVNKKKTYKRNPSIAFHHKDYTKRINESTESFDLLVSQYAGFVSHFCKKYLKIGGILLANDSHGDASMAFLDKSYKLVGVLNKGSDDHYTFSKKELDSYFVPKKKLKITKKLLKKTQGGIVYTKSPTAYIFRRIN